MLPLTDVRAPRRRGRSAIEHSEPGLQCLKTAAVQAIWYKELIEEFEKRFGHKPTHIPSSATFSSRLVHPLLPHLHNLNPKYKPQTFVPMLKTGGPTAAEEADAAETVHAAPAWQLDIDKSELRWESYVKVGYYVNWFFASAASGSTEHPVPIDLLFTGSVPSGSGLSSRYSCCLHSRCSSAVSGAAMVVASTLAFLTANNKIEGQSKGQLVETATESEKRVGVNSGGRFRHLHASLRNYVTFYPNLAAEPIPLPTPRTIPRAAFVCANSLVVSDKAVSTYPSPLHLLRFATDLLSTAAKFHYNLRVVETLVRARVLAHILGLPLTPH
ncbi:hypothetical protein C8Q74DRAFT_1373465 [Fomes fomentarius]|nr:hypothetical protein C8Q74DRAFT_1373465 [Fomes fomentarius]